MKWFVSMVVIGVFVYGVVSTVMWFTHANGDVGVWSEGVIAKD